MTSLASQYNDDSQGLEGKRITTERRRVQMCVCVRQCDETEERTHALGLSGESLLRKGK